MSRCYKMQLFVNKVTPKQFDTIVDAFGECWEIDNSWQDPDGAAFVNGTDNLYAGQSEEEFADGLAERVWTELGDFIELSISCGSISDYIGDMEYPTVFTYNHENYKRLMCQTKPVED
jgi:hypothetical protein